MSDLALANAGKGDIASWLLDYDLVRPRYAASEGALRRYKEGLERLVHRPESAAVAGELRKELENARRRWKQKRWRKKAEGQAVNPQLTTREVAVLDWIGLQMYRESLASTEQDDSDQAGAEVLQVASRSAAIRHIIKQFLDERLEELGDSFRADIAFLESRHAEMQDFWRTYAAHMKNSDPSSETRKRTPSPPGF